jgi:hypothetical protein
MAEKPKTPRICKAAWELYDKWMLLADNEKTRPSDVRLAWANYKAHRATCRDCDPLKPG